VSLEELLARSDIVTVHARLTDDTRGMFDAKAFAAMKPGAYFVNTARGEIVDQSALADALDSGHLAGAALDVFHPEPPQADERLLDRPNVITTPHLAGASRQVALESVQRVTAEVGAFLRTGNLLHCANPQWTEHG
jgi:D-3-phosphoglycerate dehydrogenase